MGQCYGKPDPRLIQRTSAPLPFVQVDPVKALLPPPPSRVKLPPQQHSPAGSGAAVVDCSAKPVMVKSCGAFQTAQPCREPANNRNGAHQRRPVPPPKPLRSTETKLSTAVVLSQEAEVEASPTPKDVPFPKPSTTHQASADNLHHHCMDEGYSTMDRAVGTVRSRVCSPPIPPTARSTPIQRIDVVPSGDDTTTKGKEILPIQLVVSKPEPQMSYSTAYGEKKTLRQTH